MVDLPILFSAPMVLALLREIEAPGTGKTQTRRVLNVDLSDGIDALFSDGRDMWEGCSWTGERRTTIPVRYFPGDRLYVREHWRATRHVDEYAPRDMVATEAVRFEADGKIDRPFPKFEAGRFRQGMHMPRWASRISLEVTGVNIERLQDCSAADARAEGVDTLAVSFVCESPDCECGDDCNIPVRNYAALWNSLHGPGAWESNPWVAAYTFRPTLGNIDAVTQ